MAPKRKEVLSSPQKQTKKAKRDPEAEKLDQQLREVMAALSKAPITPQVEKMLESILILSLGEFSDQRHQFQSQVVESLRGILVEAEKGLHKEVADAKSRHSLAIDEKENIEKESEDAAVKLKLKQEEVQSLKVALAEKAMAFRAATQALEQAEEAKKLDGKKSQEAESKKKDFETGLENLNILKSALPQEGETKQKSSDLLALLSLYKFEESMMIALPAAFAKVPEERGQFDLMAMKELEGEFVKLISQQSEIIAAAVPSQEQCSAAVNEAQDTLATARAEQRTAAKSFDAASEEQATFEMVATEAQKALRELTQRTKKLQQQVTNAEVEVELFEQGPRQTFKELCDRSTPPVAPAEEEAEMTIEASVETMEVQIPVAVC